MIVFVVHCYDTHVDDEIALFSNLDNAIACAREYCEGERNFEYDEPYGEEWLWYGRYGDDGENGAYVIEKYLDENI